jgi:hypothetical protein
MSIQKIFLALFLFVSFTQISCKKDSDSGGSGSAIVGKWTIQNIKYKESAPGVSPAEQTIPGNGATIEFKSDGTSIVIGETGYYKVSGSTLTLSSSADFSSPDVWTIQTLNSNTLTLYQKQVDTDGTIEYWINATK